MNTENDEDKKLQDAYIGYYQGQLDKAKSIFGYPLLITGLNTVLILLLIYVVPDQLKYLPDIALSISSSILTVYLSYLIINHINTRCRVLLIIIVIGLGFFWASGQLIDAFRYTITFAPIGLLFYCHDSEDNSLKNARNVAQYIESHIPEDHTAVILKHNANRLADGGDINALPLIKVLNKYGENFQIYLCLYEDDMVNVLTNPHAKRFWIFGHGKKGCLRMTDKLFSYDNFMKEHGTELHDIDTIEYVYQCHCNRGSAKPLTDCLLNERKGKLDPNLDNMPNFFDSGLADMELDDSIKSKCLLRIAVRLCSTFGKIPYIDLNYNCSSSVEYIIKRYEAHLEKKRKL